MKYQVPELPNRRNLRDKTNSLDSGKGAITESIKHLITVNETKMEKLLFW